MGRVTMKADTGNARIFDVIAVSPFVWGVVRRPGWVIIQGPARMNVTGIASGDIRQRMAERARYRRQQRHGDPGLRNRGYGPPSEDGDWAEDC